MMQLLPYPGYYEVELPRITQEQKDQYEKDFYATKKWPKRKRTREETVMSPKREMKADPYREARFQELLRFFNGKIQYYQQQLENLKSRKPLQQDTTVFRAVDDNGLKLGIMKVAKESIVVSVNDHKCKNEEERSTTFIFEENDLLKEVYQKAKAQKKKLLKQLRQAEAISYYQKLMKTLSEQIATQAVIRNSAPILFVTKVLKYNLGNLSVSADRTQVLVGEFRINEQGIQVFKGDEFPMHDKKSRVTDIGAVYLVCKQKQATLEKINEPN